MENQKKTKQKNPLHFSRVDVARVEPRYLPKLFTLEKTATPPHLYR
jgi:hypothetical protein